MPAYEQLKLEWLAIEVHKTIDPKQAALIAGVHHETIRRWCETGFIPAYKLIGRWRIDREKFEAWIRSTASYTPHSQHSQNTL
jgi:excisionase family DNA binding protein